MEEIKQLIVEMQDAFKRNYRFFKYYIFFLCEDAKNGIYLTQNEFEYTLDHLLDYAIYINIEEEFELMKNAYISIYPDSVEQYIKYYNDSFADIEED